MSRPCLYIIGPSGSGKSTLMKHLTAGIPFATDPGPPAHIIYRGGAVELGTARDGFRGTDALPLNISPRAVSFVRYTTAPALLAEGVRLAHRGFFTAVLDAGFDLTLAVLDLDPETAAERRAERHHPMSASFVKGRATKTIRLAEEWKPYVLHLDARETTEAIALHLIDHPAIIRARGRET
jgi:energy-coupling factor transporter ATP-binding protein EcfA2